MSNWWGNTHPSHRFRPDYDNELLECEFCMCRPYNDEAAEQCPYNNGGI